MRQFAKFLLELDTDDASVLIPVDISIIELFEARAHEGPIALRGSFQLDLNGACKSAWNKRSAKVFAAAFVLSFANVPQCMDEDLVAQKFNNYIPVIKRLYNDFHADDFARDSLNTQATRLRTVIVLHLMQHAKLLLILFSLLDTGTKLPTPTLI